MNRLDAEQEGAMYVPLAQSIEGFFPNWGMDVVVRTTGGLQQFSQFRELVLSAFPDAVAFGAARMTDLVAASVAERRFHLLVLGVFAALALVLATLGVGGALMLMVRERRTELAVRLALGARPARLWWEVERGGLALALVGAAGGTAAALAGARVFASLVYDIPLRDPVSYLAAPVVLILAAFVAVAVPATRATRVSPTAVLRDC
jgi:putative ABC transport system permease protein